MLPVIFATDGTLLSSFSGGHTAHPVYMTLGNIDTDVRAAQSRHAWILVGYLPTPKLDGKGLSEDAARLARARLFHECMRTIVNPLRNAGTNGELLTGGDGAIRDCFLIVACYVTDYPEQSLVCCTRAGSTCPKCPIKKTEFGENFYYPIRDPTSTLRTIRNACKQPTLTRREELLKDRSLNAVTQPFWDGLPHCNIYEAVTPDTLHQLTQGVIKHIVGWVRTIMTDKELDARYSRMPPVHGVHLFKDGISNLRNVSGPEHRQIAKQLIGCMIGRADERAICATRAILDFFYLAKYRSHSTETLEYLQEALDEFHANKQIFLDLDARAGESSYTSIRILF